MKRSELRPDPEKVRRWQQRSRERARAPKKPDARVTFKARKPARTHRCFRCGDRATSWHHWLPQQAIRVYVRGLRLTDEASRILLRDLLRDERNLSPACHHCNLAENDRSRPFTASEVPASAREFAGELGPEWESKLARRYR
jgi:hypothetical protein